MGLNTLHKLILRTSVCMELRTSNIYLCLLNFLQPSLLFFSSYNAFSYLRTTSFNTKNPGSWNYVRGHWPNNAMINVQRFNEIFNTQTHSVPLEFTRIAYFGGQNKQSKSIPLFYKNEEIGMVHEDLHRYCRRPMKIAKLDDILENQQDDFGFS